MSGRPRLLVGQDLPREPQQERSIEKRAQLKEAGLALFGEKGFEATSVEEIAKRAKLAVGGFYQHYRSKRQLLLALMDELLEKLSEFDLQPGSVTDVRTGLRAMLARAFSADLRYLGACRAWEEATLSDHGLARKQEKIRAWTTGRVTALFERLQQLPGARGGADVVGLARVMDNFFWSLLAQAVRMRPLELTEWQDSATHLIDHGLFKDSSEDKAKET
jgi:AcrR family transcriptional regulator